MELYVFVAYPATDVTSVLVAVNSIFTPFAIQAGGNSESGGSGCVLQPLSYATVFRQRGEISNCEAKPWESIRNLPM